MPGKRFFTRHKAKKRAARFHPISRPVIPPADLPEERMNPGHDYQWYLRLEAKRKKEERIAYLNSRKLSTSDHLQSSGKGI